MGRFNERNTVCFAGTFNTDYLLDAISKKHYVCTFLDCNQLTDTVIFEYDLVFVKNGENGQVLLYCSNTDFVSTIEAGACFEEKCVVSILHFFDGYMSGVGMCDLLRALECADRALFYPSITIAEAKQYIAKTESLIEIAGKIYISEYNLDVFESVWGELVNASQYDVSGTLNVDVIPELQECICDIFLCVNARDAWLKGSTKEDTVDILSVFERND